MTRHPFEDDSAEYLVLVNHDSEHSLWPAAIDVPAGWTIAFACASRQACLAYINANCPN